MFSEAIAYLENSKSKFSEKINDNFGNSIIREVYEPIENDIQQLNFAWSESEEKKIEIIRLLMELRTII